MPAKSGGGGGGATSGAIRAGRAFVEIFADAGPLHKALDRAKAKLNQFGAFIGQTGRMAATAGGLLFAPIAMLFKGAIDNAGELDDLADTFGSTTEALSPLYNAFKMAGLGAAELEKALMELAKDGAAGDVVEGLDKVMEELAGIENGFERARFAREKFGKSGGKLAAMAGDYAELKKSGAIVSSEDAKNAEKFGQMFTGALLQMQAAILPVVRLLNPMVKGITDFAKANKEAVVVIGALALGLTAVGVGLMLLGPAISAVGLAFGVLGGAIAFVASPIGIVTAGLTGLGVLFVKKTEAGKQFASELGDAFKKLGVIGQESWGGITKAIASGELELAGKIALAGLKAAWAEAMVFMTSEWNKFKAHWVDGWETITTRIAKAIVQTDGATKVFAGAGAGGVTGAAIGTILPGVGTLIGAGIGTALGAGAGYLLHNELEGADKQGMLNELDGDLRRRLGERDAARMADLDRARQAAAAELANLRAETIKADALPGKNDGEADWKKRAEMVAAGIASAKGAFDAPNLALSLGASNTPAGQALAEAKKQVAILQQIEGDGAAAAAAAITTANNTAAMEQILKALKPGVFG